jgi:hypothetical protein
MDVFICLPVLRSLVIAINMAIVVSCGTDTPQQGLDKLNP